MYKIRFLLAISLHLASPQFTDGAALDERENHGPGTFTVTQVRNDAFRGRNGLQAMLHAYGKYNVSLTPALVHAVKVNPVLNKPSNDKRDTVTGTTSATPPYGYDYEFLSPVQIGTPPQTLNLDFDTGSADLWVFSSDTPIYQINGQPIYRSEQSSTSKKVAGSTWTIGYGDGSSASGIVYTDRVAIGAAVVDNQTVESATYVSPQFTSDSASSGLVGLGMGTANRVRPGPQPTFMDGIRAQLAAPLFTANLRHGIPGSYNFGFVAAAEHSGPVQYAPLARGSPYWQFAVTGWRVGPPGAAPYASAPFTAIADTGTTLLLVPDAVVAAYYAGVAGARLDADWGAVLFPCGGGGQRPLPVLPDFAFGIGTYRGNIPGRYMNYGAVNDTHCYGGIQSSGGIGFSIFGDVALKAQFVVFDLGNMRVGFANKYLPT